MNEEHPIEGLMSAAMDSIRDMVDVNTIIGEPIETSNNIIIIPISKVGFGFAAGGSEFSTETIKEYNRRDKDEMVNYRLPFGGGSGAGVSISPVAFLVIQQNNVKLMPVCHSSAFDKLLDYVPDLIEKTNNMLNKQINCRREDKKEEERKLEKLRNDVREQLREDREKRQEKEERKTDVKPLEGNNYSVDNIEDEHIENIIVDTPRQKIKPRKMPKYDIEYDETEDN